MENGGRRGRKEGRKRRVSGNEEIVRKKWEHEKQAEGKVGVGWSAVKIN